MACFYKTITANFERFSCFNFETNFLKNKNLEYFFLIESSKIENTTFPYKTALSEANVKTKRRDLSQRVLPVTTLFFIKFCFIIRTIYKN